MTKKLVFALAGNQNSGKTTLFNQLTGSNQHVGNFPGVTVEQKSGTVKKHDFVTVVDLPGIYSLSPYSSEELVTRNYLINQRPDAIINIVDATNIERNLYLTLQLLELSVPTVLALNMMDEIRENGNSIDIEGLSEQLGIPVVPISAIKNEGIHELVDTAISTANEKRQPLIQDFCEGPVHRCIHSIAYLIEDHAEQHNLPLRFAASKLVEGDEPAAEQLDLSVNELETIEHIIVEMETETKTDREAALADMRYLFIENAVRETVEKKSPSRARARSVSADKFLTHRFLAYPVFILIMMLVFWFTFGLIGQPLSDLLAEGIDSFNTAAGDWINSLGVNPVIQSLIVNGILTGVGAVVGFLPVIITLFFFLSLLEDSGYMARIAFVMDKPLRKIGLSGRSIVPMLMGFGCSVPAIMATRTLASERDRKISILLTPFMSCSAKLPIYSAFTMIFFPEHSTLVMILLYFTGILLSIITALILKSLPYFHGNPVPFVMELPNYRLPSIKNVVILLWEKAKDFLHRAFTVIFLATMAIWLLSSFDIRFNLVEDQSQSILASVSKLIFPIFSPAGFGFWQAAVALVIGFLAKEAVLSTLAILSNTTVEGLSAVLTVMFTPLSAFSFLVFVLLYTPCAAAVSAIRRELNSSLWTLALTILQCVIAWTVSFAVYQGGLLLGFA